MACRIAYSWLLVVVVVLGGCAPRAAVGPNPVPYTANDYNYLFQAAEQVLDEQGLSLDRRDYRFGLITTRPEPLGTAMEPWRGDHESGADAIRATVNDERRRTSVVFEKDRPAGSQVRVESVIERLQLPTRYLTGGTRGHRIFASLSATPGEWRRRGIEPAYWLTVARDEALEGRLMAAINERAQLIKTAEIPPDLTQPPPLDELTPDEATIKP